MIFRWQPASTGELAWRSDGHAIADVLVTVDGDRIALVQQGGDGAAATGATRPRGLTVPGFAHAHSDPFHRALRARSQAGAGSFRTWRQADVRPRGRVRP